MRVLLVNTNERTGGAAVAANRLMEALKNNGEKAKMLVAEKESDRITVVGLDHAWRQRWHFLWERWCIFNKLHFSHNGLFDIDIANSGNDITGLREFKEADIIHLHWINQGMLSLGGIRKILRSGKPVVWTMHDLWPATGICHYARGCEAFKTGCHNCPLLPGGGGDTDLSYKVWQKKKNLYAGSNIFFVTCSRWLESQAKQSALLTGQRVTSIPNTIDTHVFCPEDKAEARLRVGLPADKRIILFVSHKVTDKRKGMDYFIKSLQKLAADNPEMKENTVVAVMGTHSEDVVSSLPFTTYPLGYIENDHSIADVYRSSDVYVLPSLEDNLPNTIMEALACGVPCVGFHVGGIPEMIDHRQNGYVANVKDTDDLAAGIEWVLCEADREALSASAVHKVALNYSQQSVAMKYIEVYSEISALKKYIR